jgi:hypothetical protein
VAIEIVAYTITQRVDTIDICAHAVIDLDKTFSVALYAGIGEAEIIRAG